LSEGEETKIIRAVSFFGSKLLFWLLGVIGVGIVSLLGLIYDSNLKMLEEVTASRIERKQLLSEVGIVRKKVDDHESNINTLNTDLAVIKSNLGLTK